MKTFMVQVGQAPVRKVNDSTDLEYYLTALLSDDGREPQVAQSTARETVRCLVRGGRYAPNNEVTELANASPVRAWWEETA